MVFLNNATIYRGGVSSDLPLSPETTSCTFRSDIEKRVLQFGFRIASKGGGTTAINFEFGMDDLEMVLTEIATNMPDYVGVLSDATSTANRRNLELCEESQRMGKKLSESVIEKLETVEEFVSEKYNEISFSKNKREREVKHKLEEAIYTLQNL